MPAAETQLTSAAHGHVLTNTAVWSPDSAWVVYDTRPDAAGSVFEGRHIERVNIHTKEVQRLYTSRNGAYCGVVTHHPKEDKVVFILGPENPTPDWTYAPSRRQGVVVDVKNPGVAINLDARDLTPPYTAGALRGGTHVHVFSPDGKRISFTYNDHFHQPDQRNVGVAFPRPVGVPKTHSRNHDGAWFSVLVTRTTSNPTPGSDQIRRAFEDAWVGPDAKAIAFQGEVFDANGRPLSEVFIAELPDDLTVPGEAGPLQGTPTTLPQPPKGTTQRRLTHTADRKYGGVVASPRHWLRSSPDGGRIAFLMRDDAGVTQVWTVSPKGGKPKQVTDNKEQVSSAFTWSPDGGRIAHTMDHSVCLTDMRTGLTRRLTERSGEADGPRPEAVVFSPDGKYVTYARNVRTRDQGWNQVFVAPAGLR